MSVNLQPVKDGKVDDSVEPEQLDQAIEIIRRRVDASGVAEPEVTRQGNTILVQIPGAKDQQEVLDAGRADRRARVPTGAEPDRRSAHGRATRPRPRPRPRSCAPS